MNQRLSPLIKSIGIGIVGESSPDVQSIRFIRFVSELETRRQKQKQIIVVAMNQLGLLTPMEMKYPQHDAT